MVNLGSLIFSLFSINVIFKSCLPRKSINSRSTRVQQPISLPRDDFSMREATWKLFWRRSYITDGRKLESVNYRIGNESFISKDTIRWLMSEEWDRAENFEFSQEQTETAENSFLLLQKKKSSLSGRDHKASALDSPSTRRCRPAF